MSDAAKGVVVVVVIVVVLASEYKLYTNERTMDTLK
jgi:hypothetical protein